MGVLLVAIVLCLISVSAAKPLTCEDLVQPLILNETQITGEWIYTEARTDRQIYINVLKTLNSSVMDIAVSLHHGTAVIKQKHMLNGACRYTTANLTVSSNTIHRSYEDVSVSITVLPACPDCLVLSFNGLNGTEVFRALKLYGKTRTLSPLAFEMFHKQAECLKFPEASFKYDEKQDFCPDEDKSTVTEEGNQDKKQ
ncbi:hypothetical protein GJAV_G00128820 [Gymnothorax javanicus]|nr:hypothetical protein GJAV_G00128820 [Gymnothorax javanicus]